MSAQTWYGDVKPRMESDDPRFAECVFAVEADSFAHHQLWADWFHKKRHPNGIESWEQTSPGHIWEIGKLAGHPVCVSVQWDRINGRIVAFYYACSRVVDHALVEEWTHKHFKARWDGGSRWAQTDAMNFHLCVHALVGR